MLRTICNALSSSSARWSATAELRRPDDLPRARLHEWRPAEEDRALIAHDDRLIRHRRNVRAARRAGTHDGRDLRDAASAHLRLVVEDPPEVFLVGEHLILHR